MNGRRCFPLMPGACHKNVKSYFYVEGLLLYIDTI